jgi:hypothetical protein
VAKGIPKLDDQFHACGRKKHRDSKIEAMLEAARLNKRMGEGTMYAYECVYHPGKWLVAHSEPQVRHRARTFTKNTAR